MKRGSRSLLFIMSIILVVNLMLTSHVFAETQTTASPSVQIENEEGYMKYLEQYSNVVSGEEIYVESQKAIEAEAEVIDSWQGRYQILKFGSENPDAAFEVDLETEGLYRIEVEYAQTEYTDRDIEVGILINGSYPFEEAESILLPRVFENEGGIRVDSVGNEVAPQQKPVLEWQKHVLMNTSGYYEGDYSFYLSEGKNKISLLGTGTEFMVSGIHLLPIAEEYTYERYLSEYEGKDTENIFVKVQAEEAKYKSASVLYPNYERVKAATEDSQNGLNNPKHISINTIGGKLWNTAGQWITWDIAVPESGYYNIGCKFKQNFLDGLFTSRAVYIDNQLLFDEMARIRFHYDDEWQTMSFADAEGNAYRVYLEEGTHSIKMMCTMGEFSDTLRNINNCVYDINELYRQIIMITSTSPDTYTDYFLEERLPELLPTIEKCRNILDEETSQLVSMIGGGGSKTAVLDTLKHQLETFMEDTDEIPLRLSSFKDNISAVGSWLVTIQEQGLLLDYLYVKSPDIENPSPDSSLITNIEYSVKRFLASFDESALLVGVDDTEGKQKITVWLNSAASGANNSSAGRDQAQIIKDLIDESFTPETGIVVDLQLVQGSLIEATLAGMGPDVALMVAEDQPVNFAIRGALQDLTEFADYEEVLTRFYDSSVEPFWYEGGLYAIPDTQVFNMLFYRTDVFEELGIQAPGTWEEFYNILPIIQRNNLQITVQDIFPALLFQNGESYYDEKGEKALLDSQTAIEAMTTYTDLYVKYGFEVKTDFYSRFRSGELVMSIQPYNMYNQLKVAAPEINGLWEMTPIPGVLQNDGTINNSQNATVSGSVMLNTCKNKEAAWEFMKWWSSDEIKAKYAISLEGMLGASARFTPANIETLDMMPWSESEVEELMCAWQSIVGIPQLPGSYYTSRGLTNAFRSIVYDGDFPRYAMRLQTKLINEEITRKREEFGLTTNMEETVR